MADKFLKMAADLHSPAASAFAITSNNSTNLTANTKFLYVGVTGALRLQTAGYYTEFVANTTSTRGEKVFSGTWSGNNVVTLSAVPAGTTLPLRVCRVYRTGTTCNGMIGLV